MTTQTRAELIARIEVGIVQLHVLGRRWRAASWAEWLAGRHEVVELETLADYASQLEGSIAWYIDRAAER